MIWVPDPVLVRESVPVPFDSVPEKKLSPVAFTPAAAAAGVYGESPALLLPPMVRVETPLVVTVPAPAKPSMVSLNPARSKLPLPFSNTLLVSEIWFPELSPSRTVPDVPTMMPAAPGRSMAEIAAVLA